MTAEEKKGAKQVAYEMEVLAADEALKDGKITKAIYDFIIKSLNKTYGDVYAEEGAKQQ